MPCQHQKNLYRLMEQTGVKLASSDVIRITCHECGEIEVCPSVHIDEYERIEGTKSIEVERTVDSVTKQET